MKSLQELAAIRDRMRQTVNTREPGEDPIRVQVGMATCNLDWFNNLSAENQQYVQEAIQAGVEAQRTMAAEENEGYITTLEEAGLTVIELTDDELQQFKDRMGNAEQVIVDEVGQDLVDELKAAIEEASAAV